MSMNAVYHIATGTTQSGQRGLSTGGDRILSSTIGAFMAAALILALLNVRSAASARARAGHVAIALLAAVNVGLSYTRVIYVGLAIAIPLLIMGAKRIAGRVTGVLPLIVPFVVLGALFVPRAAPDLVPTFVDRITASPTEDQSVQYRQRLSSAIWRQQVRKAPLIGVGFGRPVSYIFYQENSRGVVYPHQVWAGQAAHNSFLWIFAAGGIATLGAFAALLVAFALDLRRRFRLARDDTQRSLLIWSGLALLVFMISSSSGPVLGSAPVALVMWILLLLPSVVGRAERDAPPGSRGSTR
jgi:O-antigen ligase